jgi:hypothetical protein
VSSIILGNAQSDVRQGGQIIFSQLFETYPGSGQGDTASGVQIGITAATDPATGAPTPGAGSGTPLATTSAGVIALSASQYQYTWTCPPDQAPGDYLVTWSGTVTEGPVTYIQTVTVAVIPTGAPAPGVYATVAQYQAWSGDTVTPASLVSTTLMRASEAMDHYLVGAVYAVNANGMPTDPMVLDTFMRATCAQCAFMLADNDPTGVKRQYQSTAMGGVTLTRAQGAAMLPFPPLAPQGAAILHASGVLGSAALIAW